MEEKSENTDPLRHASTVLGMSRQIQIKPVQRRIYRVVYHRRIELFQALPQAGILLCKAPKNLLHQNLFILGKVLLCPCASSKSTASRRQTHGVLPPLPVRPTRPAFDIVPNPSNFRRFVSQIPASKTFRPIFCTFQSPQIMFFTVLNIITAHTPKTIPSQKYQTHRDKVMLEQKIQRRLHNRI